MLKVAGRAQAWQEEDVATMKMIRNDRLPEN